MASYSDNGSSEGQRQEEFHSQMSLLENKYRSLLSSKSLRPRSRQDRCPEQVFLGARSMSTVSPASVDAASMGSSGSASRSLPIPGSIDEGQDSFRLGAHLAGVGGLLALAESAADSPLPAHRGPGPGLSRSAPGTRSESFLSRLRADTLGPTEDSFDDHLRAGGAQQGVAQRRSARHLAAELLAAERLTAERLTAHTTSLAADRASAEASTEDPSAALRDEIDEAEVIEFGHLAHDRRVGHHSPAATSPCAPSHRQLAIAMAPRVTEAVTHQDELALFFASARSATTSSVRARVADPGLGSKPSSPRSRSSPRAQLPFEEEPFAGDPDAARARAEAAEQRIEAAERLAAIALEQEAAAQAKLRDMETQLERVVADCDVLQQRMGQWSRALAEAQADVGEPGFGLQGSCSQPSQRSGGQPGTQGRSGDVEGALSGMAALIRGLREENASLERRASNAELRVEELEVALAERQHECEALASAARHMHQQPHSNSEACDHWTSPQEASLAPSLGPDSVLELVESPSLGPDCTGLIDDSAVLAYSSGKFEVQRCATLEAELVHERAERSRAEREADIAKAAAETAEAAVAAVAAGHSQGSSPTVANFSCYGMPEGASTAIASQLRQALGVLEAAECAAVVSPGASGASKLEVWAASSPVPVLVQAGPDHASPGASLGYSPGSGTRSPAIPVACSPVSVPRSLCVPSMGVAALTHPHRGPFSTPGSAPGSNPGTPPLVIRPFVANTPPAVHGGGGRQGGRPRGRDPLEMAMEELRRAKTTAVFSAV